VSFSVPRLAEALLDLPPVSPATPLCVALSGGIDSVVLLAALAELRAEGAVGPLRARHVDHGLHPDSGAWAGACESVCRTLGVALQTVRVDVPRERGDSLEAAARAVRYEALAAGLGHDECLLTAHHGDDQMETVLLQLLRGSGPAGLAAMPKYRRLADGWLIRPLLGFTRAELEAWARGRGLAWQEDPSNRDPAPGRNFLRLKVLPQLLERWPGAAASIGRSAALCAEAHHLLEDLGQADLAVVAVDDGLDAVVLATLNPARQRNLLRLWLRRQQLPLPDSHRLQTAVEQLLPARRDARPRVDWPGASLRKYRDRIHVLGQRQLEVLGRDPRPLSWPEVRTPLPLGQGMGRLVWTHDPDGGVDARWLQDAGMEIRYRHAGDQAQPAGGDQHRRLKTLFQEIGIAPWWRSHVPLVFAQNRLLAIADRWLAPGARAAPGHAGWRLRWEDAPTAAAHDCDSPGVLVI
jgi:tRNA(Ile)-lysidine synthase